MDKPLIIANWKCNPTTLAEAKRIFSSVKKGTKTLKGVEVVICPPFVWLPILSSSASAKGSGGLALGSQDCFWEKGGAFTGEVSPSMLRNLGCRYVILGHSERRRYLEEKDEMINKKIKTVLESGLQAIFCIGEQKEQRKKGRTWQVLRTQIKKGLVGVSKKGIKNVVLAYEPVWAIGKGKPCGLGEAQAAASYIRRVVSQLYSDSLARSVRILYGGSVNSENAAGFIREAKFQGLLVGGASLKPEEFVRIVQGAAGS